MYIRRHYLMSGIIVGVLFLLLGFLVWNSQLGTRAVFAQDGPSVQVEKHVLGQQEVGLLITGKNLSNVGGFEFDLNLDASVAQVKGASLGAFLARSGRTVGSLGPILDPNGATIAFGGYSYDPSGDNRAGSSGDGALAYVTVTVKADGVTPLTLQNLIVADVNATQQNVQVSNASLQVRTLHPGWNLIAPCVDTRGWKVPEVLASLTGDFELVLGENGTYVVGLPDTFQTLQEVAPPWGYYIRVSSNHPVTLTQVAGDIDTSTPIALSRGWRWIGYCGSSSEPISQALESIDGKYDLVIGERGTYVVGLPDTFQTLQEMRLGEGYLIRMKESGNLVYPSGVSNPRQSIPPAFITAKSDGRCKVSNTPYMTLVYGEIHIDGKPAPVGSLIEAVTPRGEVAGCFEVHTAGYFGLVQVYGADEEGGIPGFRDGEPIAWRVNGQEAEAIPQVTWQDDKAVHEVVLEVKGVDKSGQQQRLFVPWLSR